MTELRSFFSNVKGRLRAGGTAVVTLLSALQLVPMAALASGSTMSWLADPNLSLQESYNLAPGDIMPITAGGMACVDGRVITKPDNSYGPEQSHTTCLKSLPYGAVSIDGYYQVPGAKQWGRMLAYGGGPMSPIAIPNSANMFNLVSGQYVQLIRNYPASLSVSMNPDETATLTVNHPADALLRDKAGNSLSTNYNTLAFSDNGQWMVIDAPFKSMLRVNTSTLEVLPFRAPFSYSNGADPDTQYGISDDGNTVFVSGSGMFEVYDLATCGTVPNAINGPVSCEKRDLMPYLNSHIAGLTTNPLRLKITDNNSMTFYARHGLRPIVTKYVLSSGSQPHALGGYLALGDSFSSGEGDGSGQYLTGTNEPENKCHTSVNSYPYLIQQQLNISGGMRSVACSGAVMSNVTTTAQYPYEPTNNGSGGWLPGWRAQMKYVALSQPSVITMTMSGNDIGFSDVVNACATPPPINFHMTCYADANERSQLAEEINGKFDQIQSMLKLLKDTAPGNAKIYIMGYPHVAKEDGFCKLNVSLSDREVKFSTALIDHLNYVIRQAASASGVEYVDISNALHDHMLCDNNSAIGVNGATAGTGAPFDIGPFSSGSYHPNEYGHQLLAQAILTATNNFTVTNPTASSVPGPTIYSATAQNLIDGQVTDTNIAHSEYNPALLPGYRLNQNQTYPLNLVGSNFGLKPNSTYTIEGHSMSITLGTATTDANGNLSASITIPADMEVGFHGIHVLGENLLNQPIDVYQPVFVSASDNDIDGDGVPNDIDPCQLITPSGQDADQDGMDDACDAVISDPPADATPPVVTATSAATPNVNNWYNQDVTLTWTSVDPDPSSGVPTQPTATVASQEGEHTYTSAQSCDPANNCATGSTVIKLDKTKPVITYSISPAANSAGWHKDTVTVTFTCADPLADQADPTSASGVDVCSNPVTVNTDGSNQQIVGAATDKAGNVQTVTANLNLDETAPNLNFTLSRTPNAQGWTTGPTTVTFDCSDATSGIASCSDPVTVTAEGGSIVPSTATDNAGNVSEVNVFVLIDSTLPTITASPDRQPNSNGWFNSDVSVGFACNDALSGILTSADGCSAPTTVTTEGANQQVTGAAMDVAGNTSATSYSVNLDKTAPVLAPITASTATKPTTGTATLTTTASDSLSGLSSGEYYLGDTDPGIGHGATLTKTGDGATATLSTTFGTDFPTGVYKVTFRAQDKASNWSTPVSDYLVVYDPNGPKFTGKRTITPSLATGDILPGLIANTQTDNAKFGFSVKYNNQGQINANSDFQFTYSTGTKCNKPAQATNCHDLGLNATSIQWLTTQGTNNSIGIFQGMGTLVVDNQPAQTVLFRVTGRDGEQMSPTATDQFQVQVFAQGADQNTATPIYRVNLGDIGRGNIKVKSN